MTESTPVAMEVWKEARDAANIGAYPCEVENCVDCQAAAAVIATALADMQRRVEELEAERLDLLRENYRLNSRLAEVTLPALSDKTQRNDDV